MKNRNREASHEKIEKNPFERNDFDFISFKREPKSAVMKKIVSIYLYMANKCEL